MLVKGAPGRKTDREILIQHTALGQNGAYLKHDHLNINFNFEYRIMFQWFHTSVPGWIPVSLPLPSLLKPQIPGGKHNWQAVSHIAHGIKWCWSEGSWLYHYIIQTKIGFSYMSGYNELYLQNKYLLVMEMTNLILVCFVNVSILTIQLTYEHIQIKLKHYFHGFYIIGTQI